MGSYPLTTSGCTKDRCSLCDQSSSAKKLHQVASAFTANQSVIVFWEQPVKLYLDVTAPPKRSLQKKLWKKNLRSQTLKVEKLLVNSTSETSKKIAEILGPKRQYLQSFAKKIRW